MKSTSLGDLSNSVRPRILDLFCCEGGAGAGYSRAGFDVLGIDVAPQPRYPFEFWQFDALEVLISLIDGQSGIGALGDFAAIHASPPCQAHTKARKLQGNRHPEMIAPVRRLLERTGLPYVIENVPGAPLDDPVELCGTMFALPLYRHRLFECSFPVTAPLHGQHWLKQVKMGRRPGEDEIPQPVGHFSDVEGARRALDTPWMSQHGMAECVPPAYCEFIGRALIHHVSEKSVAA